MDCKLKPFIPEYIPAVGDTDPFIKVDCPCRTFGVIYTPEMICNRFYSFIVYRNKKKYVADNTNLIIK